MGSSKLLQHGAVNTKRGLGGWNLPGKFKLYINEHSKITDNGTLAFTC